MREGTSAIEADKDAVCLAEFLASINFEKAYYRGS
jgi:hypothetical protein